jgi:hypothetical protein
VQEVTSTEVTIVDVRMPFWSMVVFLVKLAIAGIPAAIILFIFWGVLVAVFGSLLGLMTS